MIKTMITNEQLQQIRSVSIIDLLSKQGYHPVAKKASGIWFKAPWRDENEPSLKVSPDLNVWFDFGEEMKDMYSEMTDKKFTKIDKNGKIHLSELNSVAHINNTEYQLFFQEISTAKPNMFRLQNVVECLIDQHSHINKNGYINVEQVWIHEPEDMIMPAKLLLFLGNYWSSNNTGYLLEYENEDREVI